MNLKSILKALKLNESTISMILGAIVIVVVGVLVVNYFRGQEGETIPGLETEDFEKISLPTTHTVAQGEDLWKVSEKYYQSGYNWIDIAMENNLTNPNLIEAGQELTVPDVESKQPTVETVLSAESERGDLISGATYEVVKGDNLWNIAVRAYGDGYRWVDIAKENSLANPNLIHSGNVLTLPR